MDLTSQFVPQMFPLWIQMNGQNLVAFMQAYYEWLEAVGNVEYIASNLLNIRDIDRTFDQFIINFQYEFMNNLPASIAADRRLLLKHILNLYQSKGSKRGYALLFRILFNTNITLYLPGQDMMKLSDNQWVQPTYIEVTDSPFLAQLVGHAIFTVGNQSTALVESYDVIAQNNKVINILSLSDINGQFLFGDTVMSAEVPFTTAEAPTITGSLSASAIINGGINWNIGDLVNIRGSGLSQASGALGRVSTVMTENGKVQFGIDFGGFGYSTNAIVTVTGGGGSGATFSVGSLINQETIQINTDEIEPFLNTQLDIATEGFRLNFTSATGTFAVGENIIATSANSVEIDFNYLFQNNISTFETLSNTTLGISGLDIVNLQNNFMTVTGAEASLALLSNGVILNSSTSHSIIGINSLISPIQINSCNGTITAANTTSISIDNPNNYILATANVVGQTSGAHSNVTSVTRLTNWLFPNFANTANLDTPLTILLTTDTLVIGTIASLADQNPGAEYGSNPTVVVEEPLVAGLGISDGTGGIWGLDAVITANAVFANGIATSVQIVSAGYGFEPQDQIVMTSANNTSSILGTAIVDSQGVSQGFWTSNNSFLSSSTRLTDSYYYQNFAYEIQTQVATSQFANAVMSLMHPTGYQMFGKFAVHDTQVEAANLVFEQIQLYNTAANSAQTLINTES
jgi:hypothetical protein